MFGYLFRRLWLFCTIALLLLNVATVLNAQVFDFIHGAFSKLPIGGIVSHSKSTQISTLKKENLKLASQNRQYEALKNARKHNVVKAKVISKRISHRVARNITLNTSSVVGQSIPYLGVALILSVTAADIYDGCQTVKDTNELLTLLDEKPDVESETEICGVTPPTIDEIEAQIFSYGDGAKKSLSEYFE